MNLETDLIPLTKLSSKWIVNLNVIHKTIKHLDKNTGESPDDLENGEAFLFRYFLKGLNFYTAGPGLVQN